MKRKKLIGLVGAGLAVLASAGSYLGYQSSFTPAEREVRNIPKQIEGARSIDTYSANNARYVLVHIRQKHLPPAEAEERILQEAAGNLPDKSDVLACQKDIYKILDFEVKRTRITDVYREGLALEDEAFNNRTLESYRSRFQRLNKEQKDALSDTLLSTSIDAPDLLRIAGVVSNIRATENRELHTEIMNEYKASLQKATKLVEEAQRNPTEEVVSQLEKAANEFKLPEKAYGMREDYAISSVVENLKKEGKTLGYVVFGANHDFTDNVRAWNNQHPKEKVALIVITPEHLDK